jgi:hypothetical protein
MCAFEKKIGKKISNYDVETKKKKRIIGLLVLTLKIEIKNSCMEDRPTLPHTPHNGELTESRQVCFFTQSQII